MAQKDDIAMRRASLLKAARSVVRLRHSIEADEELNEVLPAVERAFDAAVQSGYLPQPAALLKELGVGE
jgi:hypothetical protein